MDSRESAFWVRFKANRWAYTFTILATLTVGILIGTVVSYGVKGKEGQNSSDATPLTIPDPQRLSNTFSQISKQLEPSVVNINTESTIKTARHHRSVRPDPDQDQGGDEDARPSRISSTSFSAARAARAEMRAPSVSSRSAPASLWTPRATSSPTAMWSKRRTAFA